MLFCNEGYGRTCLYMFFLSDLQYHIYSVIYPHLLLKYVSACTPFFANYVLSLQMLLLLLIVGICLSTFIFPLSSTTYTVGSTLIYLHTYKQTHTHMDAQRSNIIRNFARELLLSCGLIPTFLDYLNPNTNHPNHHLCLFRLIFFFRTQHKCTYTWFNCFV
jgi:hypothetical protein